jgi:chemotaxis protein methyltransferase CheR
MLDANDIKLILSDLNELYQYDFNYYSKDSFTRRINKLYVIEKYTSFSDLRTKLRTNKNYADHFIDRITVNVTSMFRDEHFFSFLRTKIIPQLANLPFIRIWHAGCSTGEEGFSVAILLKEAGLIHKSEIVATDVNPRVIEKAQTGIFQQSLMKLYEQNYKASGGTQEFKQYYSACSSGEKLNDDLRNCIQFRTHSLANDGYIQNFDLILCRNVLIYFDQELQNRAFQLFDTSLSKNSFLALGEKETLRLSPIAKKYEQLGEEKIWKKI